MNKTGFKVLLLVSLFMLLACSSEEKAELKPDRVFKMGFSTWPYGSLPADVESTYAYIQANGDIYSEQVDDRIPWSAWINGTPLPEEFVQSIDYKVSKRNTDLQLVLSVSPLNTGRNDLIEDRNGLPISYEAMDDKIIEDAYFKHVNYLTERLNPDYLVISMEGNELLKESPEKWEGFKSLMQKVRTRLKEKFPNLQMSASVTLHNFYEPQVADPSAYVQEISDYMNRQDFAAVSFYPFFKNQHSKSEFQQALDFLHTQIKIPIAFTETNHLAEDLIIPSLNTNISSDPAEQQAYLEVLLENAGNNEYSFIIWWAHRDYDALWETFPEEVKDIGRIWKDTGLLDEDGNPRPAHEVWQTALQE